MSFPLTKKHHDSTSAEKQLELMEHLGELRTRLLRSVIYLLLGTLAGWIFYQDLFNIINTPVEKILKEHGSKFIIVGLSEGFTIKMQMSVLMGAILASPLLTLEGWGFIAPGLTRSERVAVRLIAPLSIILFWGGVLCAYAVLPRGIEWLMAQNPKEATFMPAVGPSLLFVMKLYLGFGLVFQMPVVLMFLAKVGIVTSSLLREYWRQAVVVIGVIAAAVTPSGDAFTMMMMCVPMVGLYGLSILLVRVVERTKS